MKLIAQTAVSNGYGVKKALLTKAQLGKAMKVRHTACKPSTLASPSIRSLLSDP